MSKQPSPRVQMLSESDSDSDVYGSARRRTASRKQRRHHTQEASDSGPTHAELRFSTRRSARVSNYNEDDDDSFEEEDTDMLTPNQWVTVAEDNRPAIDAILNHRMKEGISTSPTLEVGAQLIRNR